VKRDVFADVPFDLPAALPQALPILVPDLRKRTLPSVSDFLFFDLETTGLSGGAGTVAFLAAFGRPVSDGKLRITQYLLLDYPGENDFLEAVLKEFDDQSVIVSYNGKCFDSQILKTRCLMNGIRVPVYFHADLLPPARRLWKSLLSDCSQGTIETQILGLDRSGDIPGALAPEIWFDFLKTNRTDRLTGICDHNSADISGLASMLAAMFAIADDPFAAQYRCDIERLALYWRDFMRYEKEPPLVSAFDELQSAGKRLLRLALEKGGPHAAFVYAQDELRGGDREEGRRGLLNIVESDFPQSIKADALRALAIDSERRLKDIAAALEFAKQGLALQLTGNGRQAEFERRIVRLEKKL
jgi:hypothetical protein